MYTTGVDYNILISRMLLTSLNLVQSLLPMLTSRLNASKMLALVLALAS